MRKTVLFIIVGFALTAGCTQGQHKTASPSKEGAGSHKPWANTVRLPIQDYLPSSEESYKLETARNLAIEECMRHAGDSKFRMLPASLLPPLMERRYGLSDLEQAKLYGYALPSKEAQA